MKKPYPKIPLKELLNPVSRPESVQPDKPYNLLGTHWYAQGLYIKETCQGSEIRAPKVYRVEEGDFVYNRLFAWKGSFAIATKENHNCYVSNEFPCFLVNQNRFNSKYLWRYFSQSKVWEEALGLSTGGTPTSRNRLKENKLLAMQIFLPLLDEQQRIVAKIDELIGKIEEARRLHQQTIKDTEILLESAKVKAFSNTTADGWKIGKLNEVAPINMGQSPPGESYNELGDGVPLLNGPTEFGAKHPKELQWTTSPTKLCNEGDILLCVRGATTGRMNWADKEYCIGRGLAALTPNPKICLPEYVYYFVETKTLEMLELAAGSTFPNLPGAKLKTLEVPIPSIPDQRRIVDYLYGLQERIDSLQRFRAEASSELNAFLPSILDRAFKGEL
jgi:type I restriction enzyme, S subunit